MDKLDMMSMMSEGMKKYIVDIYTMRMKWIERVIDKHVDSLKNEKISGLKADKNYSYNYEYYHDLKDKSYDKKLTELMLNELDY